jgi:hypothetical protein
VETGEVVAALGGVAHTKKRDRYSYDELAPHREKLMELARTYAELPAEKRGWMEGQIVSLGEAVALFENLAGAFDAVRRAHRFPADSVFAAAFPETGGVPLSVVLQRMPGVLGDMQARRAEMSEEEARRTATEAGTFLDALETDLAGAWNLALFPPENPEASAWRSLAEVAAAAFQTDGPPYREDPLLPLLRTGGAARRPELRGGGAGLPDGGGGAGRSARRIPPGAAGAFLLPDAVPLLQPVAFRAGVSGVGADLGRAGQRGHAARGAAVAAAAAGAAGGGHRAALRHPGPPARDHALRDRALHGVRGGGTAIG